MAIAYTARGWSVIPLQQRGKRPLLPSWSEYQSQRASEEEIREWWTRWPDANVGVVTGQVSGLIVLDLDGPGAVNFAKRHGVPPTVVASTGKGWHVYFQHPGQPVQNAAALDGVKGLDVRGDGGYVVAPPSVHPSGRVYQWAKGRSPDDLPLAPCPEWLLKLLAGRDRAANLGPGKEPGWVEQLLQGVPEGQRDDACTRLAGHYLGKGLPESEVLALLLAWNQRNRPPLPEGQVEKCVRSVAGREARKPARPGAQPRPGFRLEGPVFAPENWQTLVICRDWARARELAAAGNAVVVARRDGTLPPEAGRLVAAAADLKMAGFSADEARRLAWELYPLRLVSRAATEGTAALRPEPKPAKVGLAEPEPAQETEPEQKPEPVPAAPPPASDPATNRFLLETWLNQHRPDLLARIRQAEKKAGDAWWDAEAGFPGKLRTAEAALEAALEAGRQAMREALAG
jgi:hypothetical protein